MNRSMLWIAGTVISLLLLLLAGVYGLFLVVPLWLLLFTIGVLSKAGGGGSKTPACTHGQALDLVGDPIYSYLPQNVFHRRQ